MCVISGVLLVIMSLTGCVSNTPNTIQITQGYEQKRVISKTEALHTLSSILSTAYPPIEPNPKPPKFLPGGGFSNIDANRKVFDSLDENGYVYHIERRFIEAQAGNYGSKEYSFSYVYDKVINSITVGNQIEITYERYYITNYFHFEASPPIHVMFSDVARIESAKLKGYADEVDLFRADGSEITFYQKNYSDEQQRKWFPEPDFLSALLTLCSNVK
jgi:hypothetical protein